jgi:hypothetical protein
MLRTLFVVNRAVVQLQRLPAVGFSHSIKPSCCPQMPPLLFSQRTTWDPPALFNGRPPAPLSRQRQVMNFGRSMSGVGHGNWTASGSQILDSRAGCRVRRKGAAGFGIIAVPLRF